MYCLKLKHLKSGKAISVLILLMLLSLLWVFQLFPGKSDSLLADNGNAKADVYGPEMVLDVLITFTKAKNNINLQNKFSVCVSSMLGQTSGPLNLHVVGESSSLEIARV